MVTLVTNQKYKWGQTNILPYIGKTQISENGEIEVEDEKTALAIVRSNCGFVLKEGVSTEGKPEEDKKEIDSITSKFTVIENVAPAASTISTTPAAPAEEVKEEVEDSDKEDDKKEVSSEDIRKQLEGKTVADLKKMAEVFPGNEWRVLVKADLIDYLVKKIESTDEAE